MASLAEAVAERSRIHRRYRGVTCRTVPYPDPTFGPAGLSIHDVRASEARTSAQKTVEGGPFVGWSAPVALVLTLAVFP